MLENNNLFLYNLKAAIKYFTNFITTKKVKPYQTNTNNKLDMILFYSSYHFLTYSINVIYSNVFFNNRKINVKELFHKYDFAWCKEIEKCNTAYFLFNNLLKIIDGNEFYAKFCAHMLKYPANELSAKLLKNNKNLKMLELHECANFLMLLIYEPMVHYVELKKSQSKLPCKEYANEKLQQIFYDLDYYARKLIPVITLNKQQYVTNVDDNIYIKVSSITSFSNFEIKELYHGLRTNILLIFPKQKDVSFFVNNNSPLTSTMFNDRNINFKEFIKLIIKNKTWFDFIKNIKEKKSKYMSIKYWEIKIMANLGNIILMNLPLE